MTVVGIIKIELNKRSHACLKVKIFLNCVYFDTNNKCALKSLVQLASRGNPIPQCILGSSCNL